MIFFTAENEDLHNEPEQLLRQERIGEEDETKYETTLGECTCADFRFRRKPCKHMYRLAMQQKMFVNKSERSRELIADFSSGYAKGWRFVVRSCNWADLDIRWQKMLADGEKRGKNSRKQDILTQGNLYNFVRGEIFYDNLTACFGKWREALREMKYAIQIDEVTASNGKVGVFWEENRFVRRNVPIYGTVKFTVYTPTEDYSGLIKVKSYYCRQDEFVSLLKTGSFADSNGEVIELN